MRSALAIAGLALASAAALPLRAEPPTNPSLARSGWPIFHSNTYAQASLPSRGPEASDRIEVQFIETPRRNVSSWTVLTAPYPGGAQAAWGTSRTH